ncbi:MULTISPECIES: SDR family NAD(P)-dependent oxidoreductase [Rhodococcus]|uniref:SDR family oxidoreductase n=1 Tax=Rhodococcus rhodochrous TaxID=1829 RepID=A0AAW4XQB7_RHORH|nr:MULTISPECIES: SDR family NAD(P)-dependent oxidoreductase [Rhodococcus]MCD2115079.1 SDR family oxidoreductase [Rhodococcus rhodochrous]
MRELENKIALVVGAGTDGDGVGLGRATAIIFAREGAHVVCADVSVESAERTAEMIRAEGHRADSCHVDVTDEQQVKAVIDTVVQTHGRLDVLHNNVGIATAGGVTDLAVDDWGKGLALNLTGAFFSMRHAIPHMVAAGGGSIVNISSAAAAGWSGVPYAAYYAGKAGLEHLSRTTAVEFASQGVRVNVVQPGLIKTPMVARSAGVADAYADGDIEAMWSKRNAQTPMGHMGEAWDVAHASLFLASERAKYISGAVLPVDGALTASFVSPS